MAEPDPIKQLALDFQKLSVEERVNWLLAGLRGEIPELILSPGGSPSEGLELLAEYLSHAHGLHLSTTSVRYLTRWVCASGSKPKTKQLGAIISGMLELLSADPTSASAQFLRGIVSKGSWFDALPKQLRFDFLNALENQRDITPSPILHQLFDRRPAEYGVHVFCILASTNFSDALNVLPKLPDTAEVRHALELSVDWLLEILPPNGRTKMLAALAAALASSRPAIRAAMTNAFAEAGCPLPQPSAASSVSTRFLNWLHTLGQGERKATQSCRSLFCRA